MQLIPHEFVLFTGIYLSPLLVGVALAQGIIGAGRSLRADHSPGR